MKPDPAKTWQTCGGALLVAIGIFGCHYSARAARAHLLYREAKYGACREDVPAVLRACEAAHRIYPHNYYLCIWAAEQAYRSRQDVYGEERSRRLRAAESWCDVGLALNRYKSQLHLLKARLLEPTRPVEAAALWARYVDWHFWEPYNHAVLVDLYASAGDFDRAAESLDWVRGSKHYEWALARLQDAWKQEWRRPMKKRDQ